MPWMCTRNSRSTYVAHSSYGIASLQNDFFLPMMSWTQIGVHSCCSLARRFVLFLSSSVRISSAAADDSCFVTLIRERERERERERHSTKREPWNQSEQCCCCCCYCCCCLILFRLINQLGSDKQNCKLRSIDQFFSHWIILLKTQCSVRDVRPEKRVLQQFQCQFDYGLHTHTHCACHVTPVSECQQQPT